MNRPRRTTFAPWRSKSRSTRSTCSRRVLNRGPCASRNGRPIRRPRRKVTTSPATAAAQTGAISSGELDLAALGDDAADEDCGLAGHEQPDESADLQEGQ